MTYKTARNLALKDAARLITGDYHDNEWTTDGYFAIEGNMFADYKAKKKQEVMPNRVKFDTIIDRREKYEAAKYAQKDSDEFTKIYSDNSLGNFMIQTRYLNVVLAYFPDAEPLVSTEDKFAPVQFKLGDRVVGVIMPIKQ